MKKNKVMLAVLIGVIVVLLLGAALLVVLQNGMLSAETVKKKTLTYNESGHQTFAEFTSVEIFKDIPALYREGAMVGMAEDYGSDNYLLSVDATTKEDYDNYLQILEESGFKKHSDNGEEGMAGFIYTSNYTKGDLVLTITHMSRLEKTTVSASKTMKLSEHLVYKDEYVANLDESAKTKVHMLELNEHGSSFVIELRNGHFILEDGGTLRDALYLLDYLEELTPGDEIPVIEAWFISHAHGDHHGAIREIMLKPELSSRIRVNGIYFVEPGKGATDHFMSNTTEEVDQNVWYIKQSANTFKNGDGGACGFYRPQIGQRYYFCDMSIEVVFTIEQIKLSAFSNDFNDTSTWLMHNIEGQTFLCGGDGAETECTTIMKYFDREYFDVDIFSSLHHGINVYNYFTDYMTVDTLLYTSWRAGSIWTNGTWQEAIEQNEHLRNVVTEYYHRGDGTVILTFPYKIGSAEIAAPCDWRYSEDGKPYRSTFDWNSPAK